jgi:hypothetical protein
MITSQIKIYSFFGYRIGLFSPVDIETSQCQQIALVCNCSNENSIGCHQYNLNARQLIIKLPDCPNHPTTGQAGWQN